MIGERILVELMRQILQLVATCLGSLGVMALYGSFLHPDCGLDAIMMLSVASLINLGIPRS